MGKNLTGIYKSLANKKSRLKAKGIDVSFIPKNYTSLSENEVKNLMNKLDNKAAKKKKETKVTGSKPKKTSARIPKSQLNELLEELNFKRKQMESTKKVNMYLGSYDVGEFQSLSELNFLLDDFKNIKGDITGKDITQVAKKNGFKTQKNLARIIKEKLAKFHMNTYSETLKFYGITDEQISKLDKEFRKADYKKQDKFLKIVASFKKGKDKYETIGEEYSDHSWARDNFFEEFTRIVMLGD